MYKAICYLTTLLILLQSLNAQQFGTLKDSRDGKVYKTVKIGEQEWMAENLHTFYFRNGDQIPIVKSIDAWNQAYASKSPACCYYENNIENGKIYGLLYNYYAIIDKRGIAPKGWHVANESEFHKLIQLCGYDKSNNTFKSKYGWDDREEYVECNNCKNWNDEQKAGIKCNSCNDKRMIFDLVSNNGTNITGFSALPGGLRIGEFKLKGEVCAFWLINSKMDTVLSGSINNSQYGWGFFYIPLSEIEKDKLGLSIRCVNGN